jgi:hypothetical protein
MAEICELLRNYRFSGLSVDGGMISGASTISVGGSLQARAGAVNVVLADAGTQRTSVLKTGSGVFALNSANLYSGDYGM